MFWIRGLFLVFVVLFPSDLEVKANPAPGPQAVSEAPAQVPNDYNYPSYGYGYAYTAGFSSLCKR